MADQAEKASYYNVTWKIQNVGLWLTEMEDVSLTSENIHSTKHNQEWYLRIDKRSYGKAISLTFNVLGQSFFENEKMFNIFRNSEVMFLSNDSGGKNIKLEIESETLGSNIKYFISEFKILNKKDIYFPDDTLTILCKIPNYDNHHCYLNTVLQQKVFLWNIESFSKSSVSINKFQIDSFNITIHCKRLSHENFQISIKNNHKNAVYFKIIIKNTNEEWIKRVLTLDYSKKFCVHTSQIPNDILTLKVMCVVIAEKSISYKNSAVTCHPLPMKPQGSPPMAKILQDGLFDLYKNKIFCDATLKTGSTTFPVHKNTLSAISPVFCAMFEDHTLEGQTGIADVSDLDQDTVKEMIAFLYHGNSLKHIQWDGASKLYYAADKYHILPLKKACLSILKSELSISNACQALVLADTHQDQDLLKYVQKYIANDNSEVLSTSEWVDLEKSNPKLLLKVLKEIQLKSYKDDDLSLLPKASNQSNIEKSLPSALQNGLLRLYYDKKFCDAKLIVDKTTFPVHRNVLCAVSPVFYALFEDKSDIVDIPDVDSDTMKKMLLYVYDDSPEDLQWDEVLKLFRAADMYGIQPLKETCLSMLKAKLSVSNACCALVLADALQDGNFLTYVQEFICNNDEVLNSVEWRDLEESHAKLVVKVMREIHFQAKKK